MNMLKQITIFILAAGLFKFVYAQGNDRYAPPNINQAHKDFLSRTDRDLLNIDFIIANALGEIKSAINDGEEVSNNVLSEDGPSATNSVIVQPGADADNATIINITEGDITAITR